MSEKTGGKRLAPDQNKSKKIALAVLAASAAVVLCAYIALCAYASRDIFWTGTTVMGVDISGLTTPQAAEKLSAGLPGTWAGRTVVLSDSGSGKRFSLEADGLMEPEDLVRDLDQAACGGHGRSAAFLGRGGWYLARRFSKATVNVIPSLTYTAQGRQRVDQLLDQIAGELEVTGRGTVWHYSADAIIFVKGRTGVAVDREGLQGGITLALTGTGPEEVAIPLVETPPAEPDLDSIYDEVFTTAAAAYLDPESREVVPSVIGRELDIERAKAILDAGEEGEICQVELVLTTPSPTTEELNAILFRDVLGEATTRVTGTADRRMNVGVAANFLNGHIIFPGEEFSFNQVCSPYSVTNGYGKATAYVNGLSKDTVAGGICQASSTLYWATLKANLETVERSAHRYEPTYIRGGLDATVYGDYGDDGGLDFRFKNSTEQPIQLEAYMDEKNYLHVLIHGTDATGVHGEPYSTNRVITQAYQTIYEANESVPQGTTRKDPERTGYNGVSIETYQKLVDNQGKVVEEKLLYKTKYYVRNEVIFFNPVDIWLWNIDPVTGVKLDSAADPAPGTSQSPEESPAGTGTPDTGETPEGTGAPSDAPVQEPGGEESQRPIIYQPPAAESYEPILPPPVLPTSQPAPQPTMDPDEPMLPPGL